MNDLIIGICDPGVVSRQLKSAAARRQPTQLDPHDDPFDDENNCIAPFDRYISAADVEQLADTLVDTEDTLELGLSQIGIDPDEFKPRDLHGLRCDLAKLGVRFNDETGWTRE